MSAKYTKERLQEAVDNSESVTGVLRFFGLRLAGGTMSHLRRKIDEYGIDTSHFTGQGHMKGKPALSRRTAEELLVLLPEGSRRTHAVKLRRALADLEVLEVCVECGIMSEWNGKKLQLHVDHIDGNWLDNRIENLRFLCPNCHSQQEDTNRPWKHN